MRILDLAKAGLASRWLLPLKIAVSAAVLAFLISRIQFHVLTGLSWWLPVMIAAGCLINLAALTIMASRWQILIHAAAGQRLRFRSLYGYYLVGAFYSNLLPGAVGGDFIRIKRLVDRHSLRWARATRITVVERLMGLSGVLLFACVTLPFAHLPASWDGHIPGYALPSVAAAGIVAFVAGNYWLCHSLKDSPMTPMAMAGTSALVILGQTSDMFIIAMFLAILGMPLGPVNLAFSVSLAYLAAVLPISLGGLGVREGVLTAMLSLNGIAVATAALLSVLLLCARLTTAAIGVVVDVRTTP